MSSKKRLRSLEVSMMRMSTVWFALLNGLVLSFKDCLKVFGTSLRLVSSLMMINLTPIIRSHHTDDFHLRLFWTSFILVQNRENTPKSNMFGSIFLLWLCGFQISNAEIYSLLTTSIWVKLSRNIVTINLMFQARFRFWVNGFFRDCSFDNEVKQ